MSSVSSILPSAGAIANRLNLSSHYFMKTRDATAYRLDDMPRRCCTDLVCRVHDPSFVFIHPARPLTKKGQPLDAKARLIETNRDVAGRKRAWKLHCSRSPQKGPAGRGKRHRENSSTAITSSGHDNGAEERTGGARKVEYSRRNQRGKKWQTVASSV